MVSSSRMAMVAAVAVQLVVLLCGVVSVDGHGWLSSPPSRQDQCHSGVVKNCGEIQYEPQSVEALKGKMTCNGDVAEWAVLADNTMPWVTTPIGSGINTFTWTQTAIHVAADWEYYINNTLIAKFLGTANTIHCVDLTGYTGYQKILAVWNIGDTADAFYSCVDVNVGAGVGSGSTCVGGGATVFTPVTNTGCTSTTTSTSYIVSAGDTLQSIASTDGLTLAALLAVNPLKTASSVLEVGTTVIIPPTTTVVCGGASAGTTPSVTVSSTGVASTTSSHSSTGAASGGTTGGVTATTCLTNTPTTYTMSSSDSLQSVATARGITLEDLLRVNPGLLSIGQSLSLPISTCGLSSTGPAKRRGRDNETDDGSTGLLGLSGLHGSAAPRSAAASAISAVMALLLAVACLL